MKLPLNDLIRACDVTRWHTVNTAKKQTLADHHWGTTMILMRLLEAIAPLYSFNEPKLSIITACLLHDIDEVYKGDVPAPRKDASYGAGHLTVPFTDDVQAIIKVCDAIEALFWINNNYVGYYAFEFVRNNCAKRLERRISQAASQFFGDGFEDVVNEVVQELTGTKNKIAAAQL